MSNPPGEKSNWCSHTPGGDGHADTCPSCGKPTASQDKSKPNKGKGKSKGKDAQNATDSQSSDGSSDGESSDGSSDGQQANGTCSCPGSGTPMSGMDAEASAKIADSIIGEVLREALNGNQAAINDLKKLMDDYEDSEAVSGMFGHLGVGKLFGQAPPAQKVSWVGQFVKDIIDSKLRQAARLIRKEKIWWEDQLVFRGPEKVRKGIVLYDASASMPSDIVQRFTELIGEEDGLELMHWSFDAQVWPAADEYGIRGGGGTSFRPGYDLACKEDEVHFLLYVTDGYAPALVPDGEIDADKVIWVITPGGHDWPAEDPIGRMQSVKIDEWSDLGL